MGDYVKVAIVLNDKEPSGHRLFKAEVVVDTAGQHFKASTNRNSVKTKGFYVEPDVIKSPSWVLDYQPNIQRSYTNHMFIDHQIAPDYLNGGTLTINAKVRYLTIANNS
jgi:hypothetical protein